MQLHPHEAFLALDGFDGQELWDELEAQAQENRLPESIDFSHLQLKDLENGADACFQTLSPMEKRNLIFGAQLALTPNEKREPLSGKSGDGSKAKRVQVGAMKNKQWKRRIAVEVKKRGTRAALEAMIPSAGKKSKASKELSRTDEKS